MVNVLGKMSLGLLYSRVRYDSNEFVLWKGCVERMDLHQLAAFEAVARERSFTRAAESLFLTQPAVTRQVAALEAELKTRLFDRLGRSVRLTTSGEALRRYADAILRLVREAEQAVADVGTGIAGRLTLGASDTLATYVLPPLLRAFRRAHPGVEIAIHTGVSADVLEMVAANRVDLGLVTRGETVGDPRLEVTILADYETRVGGAAGAPARAAGGERDPRRGAGREPADPDGDRDEPADRTWTGCSARRASRSR
jgi:DNA-binding transcriptional LysR family regulator